MKTLFFKHTCSLITGLIISLTTVAQPVSQPFETTSIIYRPPAHSIPIRRNEVTQRGRCKQVQGLADNFSLQVLAPDTVGQTTLKQPTLYWTISQPVIGRFTFTLGEETRQFVEPLLEETLVLNVSEGLQALSLADYQVTLQADVVYRWAVSLECDAENPSQNWLSVGLIKQVAPVAALEKSIQQAKLEKLPYLYAISGYWYDALDSLAELIRRDPNDKKWREVLTNLLKQGGVGKVARLEKRN